MALATRAPRFWRAGLLLAAGALLTLAGCGNAPNKGISATKATMTPTATATPAPIILTWHAAPI